MLKLIKHSIIFYLLLFGTNSLQGQIKVQWHHLKLQYDSLSNTVSVKQQTELINHNKFAVNHLIWLNWANAYQNKHTALARHFIENYDLSFHFSGKKNKGAVRVKSIKINKLRQTEYWHALKADVFRLDLPQQLTANDTLIVDFEYVIKLPNAKFTGYGVDKKGTVLLKDFYFQPVPYNRQTYANKNIDAYPAWPTDFEITLKDFPDSKTIISNLNTHNHKLQARLKHPEILITSEPYTKYKFESKELIFPENNTVNDLDKVLINNKLLNYFKQKLGTFPGDKILITHSDFEQHKVYGLDLLPKFLNPYDKKLVWEISMLHQISLKYAEAISTDRRQYAWLVDGLAAFMDYDYLHRYYSDLKLLGKIADYKLVKFYYASQIKMTEKYPWLYLYVARLDKDQALKTALDSLTNFNRNVMMPYKAALGFKMLQDQQPKQFDEKLKTFYRQALTQEVNEQHFFDSFLNVEPRQWFKAYIHTRQKYDYKLKKVYVRNDSIYLSIKNKNHNLLPLTLYALTKNQVLKTLQLKPFKQDTLIKLKYDTAIKYLGFNYYNDYPELQNKNNFKRLGFHLWRKPLQIRLFQDFDNPLKSQIFVNPFFEYNYYDGIILGTQIFNESLLFNHFKYVMTPSYAGKSRQLTGSFSVSNISFFKGNRPYALDYGFSYRYYHYNHNLVYRRYNPHISLKFRDPYLRNRKASTLGLQYMLIDKDPIGSMPNETEKYGVFDLHFSKHKVNIVKDLFYMADLQFGQKFGKTALMLRYRFLSDKNRQWDFRIYAGKFLYNHTKTDYFSFALDRPTDYLFQYRYYGRSESSGIFHQQFVWAEGGFKTFFADQYANDYLISNNVNLGIWRWFNLYGDWAWLKRKEQPLQFYYDSGLRINLVQDYFEIFFPVYSKLGWEVSQPDYLSRIRIIFTMDINGLFRMFKRGWY